MSDEKAVLQQKLKDLELAECKQYAEQKLLDATKTWVGKAYSTNLFDRGWRYAKFPNKTVTLSKCISARIHEDDFERDPSKKFTLRFRVTTVHINMGKRPDEYFSFSVNTGENTNEPFGGYSFFRHEIPVSVFDAALEEAKASIEITMDAFRSRLKEDEYITQGDHQDLESKMDKLKSIKAPMVQLPSRVRDILVMEAHPFVFKDMLLNYPGSKKIIEDMIKKLKENASFWGGKIYERDTENARTLSTFLTSTPELL